MKNSATQKNSWPRLNIMLLCALLSACGSMTETYERPALDIPSVWSHRNNQAITASDAVQPEWWKLFGDTQLDQLINDALLANYDLKIARARVGEADAAVDQVRAAALPSASLGGGATYQNSRNPFTGQREGNKQYNASGELNWELDLWGKTGKGVNARRAAVEASEAEWRATYLSVVSNVASSYFLVRQLDQQISMQEKSLGTAKKILAIYRAQLREGIVANTQVLRQSAEINTLKRRLLDLQRQRAVTVNALATLVGNSRGDFSVPEGNVLAAIKEPPVPGNLPSDLLVRRPDIVAAEYRVLEAHELVGEASLARLPSISLTASGRGGGDLASASLSTLVKSLTYGIGPSVRIPIFDPNVKSKLRSSKASAKVREEQYRKTVITAFQEVENALIDLASHRAQREQLRKEVRSLKTVANQTRAQLREGLVNQLQVFESERRLLATEQSLLGNHQQILSDTVTLYKALGGGWASVAVADAQ
jgi:NodT family efflux transporter outer membrane factor (OMF) lipoprotein